MAKTKVPKPAKPKPPKKIKIKKAKANKTKGKAVGAPPPPPPMIINNSNSCAGFKPTGNIFKDSLSNASCLQDSLLGPTYPYWKNIRSPSELGMSDKGSISVMAKDVAGLINYVELLVTGSGKASKTGKPLGNKFFLKTGAKCTDSNKNLQDRYVYINNVPLGNIPFISSGMGTNFKEMRGLLPGTMSNLNSLNPLEIIQGFSAGGSPPCQKVTLQTISTDNKTSTETHYMTTLDIQSMDPCSFMNGKNPITNKKCKQAFGNISSYSNEYYNDAEYYESESDSESDSDGEDVYEIEDKDESLLSLPKDPILQIYLACLGILGVYILYRMMMKSKK